MSLVLTGKVVGLKHKKGKGEVKDYRIIQVMERTETSNGIESVTYDVADFEQKDIVRMDEMISVPVQVRAGAPNGGKAFLNISLAGSLATMTEAEGKQAGKSQLK